jgi:hypothetical protein
MRQSPERDCRFRIKDDIIIYTMKCVKILKKFNVNKIPLIMGLVLVLEDVCIWSYAIYKFFFVFNSNNALADVCANMIAINLPSSILASIMQYSFFQKGNFTSFFILIFTFSIVQYFIIGFFYGLIILGAIKLGQQYRKQLNFIKDKLVAIWKKINII